MQAFAAHAPPPATVLTHTSRCPSCEITIHTHGTTPPSVCPYCRRALVQDAVQRPLAEAMEPPSDEEVAGRRHALYHRPHAALVTVIALIALFLLAWAVFVQLRSIENYFYQPFVSIYSAMAGLFVITRFLFAAFYHAPADSGFGPTVTVLVPCFNEGAAIRTTIERIFASRYNLAKLEVVCVNDGSSDDSLRNMLDAQKNWKQYTRQQARWMRSYLREIWKTGKFIWRKHPVPALSWYAMMWMPIVEPFVMLQALVIAPIQAGAITPSYTIGVMCITAVWALHFWATTGRKWWWAGFAFTLSYIVFYSWQLYWALFTLKGKKWGTRG